MKKTKRMFFILFFIIILFVLKNCNVYAKTCNYVDNNIVFKNKFKSINEKYIFINNYSSNYQILLDSENDVNCTSILGDPKEEGQPAYYLSFAFHVIKYIAIVLLIIMTLVDFVTVTASQDKEALKKAKTKAIKRMLICVIILILPTLIDFILKIVHRNQIKDCINIKFPD